MVAHGPLTPLDVVRICIAQVFPDVAQRQEANDLGSLQGEFESHHPD